MTNTSSEYLWTNTKLSSTTKPLSVRRPVTETSPCHNESNHTLSKLETLLHPSAGHSNQSRSSLFDKTSLAPLRHDCPDALPFLNSEGYSPDFPEIGLRLGISQKGVLNSLNSKQGFLNKVTSPHENHLPFRTYQKRNKLNLHLNLFIFIIHHFTPI